MFTYLQTRVRTPLVGLFSVSRKFLKICVGLTVFVQVNYAFFEIRQLDNFRRPDSAKSSHFGTFTSFYRRVPQERQSVGSVAERYPTVQRVVDFASEIRS